MRSHYAVEPPAYSYVVPIAIRPPHWFRLIPVPTLAFLLHKSGNFSRDWTEYDILPLAARMRSMYMWIDGSKVQNNLYPSLEIQANHHPLMVFLIRENAIT
jgi:hypothetical protein